MLTPLTAPPPNMITILADSAVKSHLEEVLKILWPNKDEVLHFYFIKKLVTRNIPSRKARWSASIKRNLLCNKVRHSQFDLHAGNSVGRVVQLALMLLVSHENPPKYQWSRGRQEHGQISNFMSRKIRCFVWSNSKQ